MCAYLDDYDWHGQVGCSEDLIKRVLEVVDNAGHKDSKDEVVLDLFDVAGGTELDLGDVAHKLQDVLEEDGEG